MVLQNEGSHKGQKSSATPKQLKRETSVTNSVEAEAALQDLEYSRRRSQMNFREQFLKKDNRFQCAKLFYILGVGVILAGSSLIIHCSFHRSTHDFATSNHEIEFQIIGGLMVGLGVVIFMIISAYTYHRENKLRRRLGLPSVYQNSMPGMSSGDSRRTSLSSYSKFHFRKASLTSSISGAGDDKKNLYNPLTPKFSDKGSKHKFQISNNLGDSFTSRSTVMTLIHTKNESELSKYENDELSKRINRFKQDKNLSKARILAWQKECFSGYSETKCSSSESLNRETKEKANSSKEKANSSKEKANSSEENLRVVQHHSVINISLSDIEEVSGSSPVSHSLSSNRQTVLKESCRIENQELSLESSVEKNCDLSTEVCRTENPCFIFDSLCDDQYSGIVSEIQFNEENCGMISRRASVTPIPKIVIEEWSDVRQECD